MDLQEIFWGENFKKVISGAWARYGQTALHLSNIVAWLANPIQSIQFILMASSSGTFGEKGLCQNAVREFDDDPSCIVWPASRVLLQWLHGNLDLHFGASLEGAKILELGAGTGFLALSLANAGACSVVAVEGDEHGFANLEYNVRTSHDSRLIPLHWDWEKEPGIPSQVPLELDLILGSDIVYPRYYDCNALCRCVFHLLTRGPDRRVEPLVLFSLCDRATSSGLGMGLTSLTPFFAACEKWFLNICELPIGEEIFRLALPTSGNSDLDGHDDPGAASGTKSHIRMFRITRSTDTETFQQASVILGSR